MNSRKKKRRIPLFDDTLERFDILPYVFEDTDIGLHGWSEGSVDLIVRSVEEGRRGQKGRQFGLLGHLVFFRGGTRPLGGRG